MKQLRLQMVQRKLRGNFEGQIPGFKSIKDDKLYIFLLFRPEFFGKWCLEFFFFDTTTLMPALIVPAFYYIMHLCEIEQNGKFNFFQFFQKQKRVLLFKYFTYIKNVIFWGTSCWCSSKFDIVWEGAHKLQSQLLSHSIEVQFLSYISLIYLKRSHFFIW